MSMNILNDISAVYMEQVAESAVPGKPAERLGAVTAIPKSEQEAARERTLAKAKAKREKMSEAVKGVDSEMRKAASDERKAGDKRLSPSKGKEYADHQKQQIAYMDKVTKKNKNVVGLVTKEALDPVGQEDADIDNDGDTDKSDKYLHKRRKAIGKAISKRSVKEGYSNWRQDLAEVIADTEKVEKVTEKKVNNKIEINPKLNLGEAVEEIGGTLLEMVEIDEVDFIVESVYGELLDEGYEEDDIEEAIEYALTEATVTYGHDTDKPQQKKTGAGQLIKAVGRLARQKLSSKVRGAKKSASAAVARGARKVAKGALGVARKMEGGDKAPKTAERKPSTYRGAGAGTKERVSSGSYTPPTKKKAEKPSDPWGEPTTPAKPKAKTKKTTAPKAKAPATTKRKRKSKLDDLLASVRSEQVQQIDELSVNKMLDYKKKAEKNRDELNKKWDKGTATYREKMRVLGREEGEARASRRIEKKTGKHPLDMNKLDKLKAAVTKEETQIDEKTLTKMEMKKREEIVKSMKDKASDFEKRYPGRGKEVMYATATKMAKKVAEQVMATQTPEPATDGKKEMLDKQKLANMKMMQQKQQVFKKKELEMKKSGKLPLEAN
jgi:hypothetical protein